MAIYADLFELPEKERIDAIGHAASGGALVAFVVEDDAKADRYLKQLHARFRIRVIERGAGPVKDTVFVKVGPEGH
jgi:hypothetical protein